VSDPDPKHDQLLEAEARFWDLQEERIGSLYARPHDWRFVPVIAERIIRPRVRTSLRLIDGNRDRIHSLLDIGCGNGWWCHAMAKRGIRSIGIDLSQKKIETAKRMAAEQGVAHLCEFVAGDVMKWRPEQPVDLLTSYGSLHHFPAFERAIDHLVQHHLKPGGLMLFVEPHFEGMAPEVRTFLLRCASNRFLKRLFDIDFYLEVTGRKTIDGPEPQIEGVDMNVRHESPAGKQFFGDHVDLDHFFCSRFEVIEREFFHYFAGHATNAFYVFMKSRLARGLWRLVLPFVVWRDTRLLRRPEYQKYAEEGLWFLRAKGGT